MSPLSQATRRSRLSVPWSLRVSIYVGAIVSVSELNAFVRSRHLTIRRDAIICAGLLPRTGHVGGCRLFPVQSPCSFERSRNNVRLRERVPMESLRYAGLCLLLSPVFQMHRLSETMIARTSGRLPVVRRFLKWPCPHRGCVQPWLVPLLQQYELIGKRSNVRGHIPTPWRRTGRRMRMALAVRQAARQPRGMTI